MIVTFYRIAFTKRDSPYDKTSVNDHDVQQGEHQFVFGLPPFSALATRPPLERFDQRRR